MNKEQESETEKKIYNIIPKSGQPKYKFDFKNVVVEVVHLFLEQTKKKT